MPTHPELGTNGWIRKCASDYTEYDKKFPTLKEKRYAVAQLKEWLIPTKEIVQEVFDELKMGGFFEEDAYGGSAATEGSGNPGGQTITGGGADHQYLLGAILDGALGLGVSNLATNIGFTTDRMSGGADKAANLGFDNHMGSRHR